MCEELASSMQQPQSGAGLSTKLPIFKTTNTGNPFFLV